LKRIAILGSTGSIGCSTLKVASALKNEIEVVGIAARSNVDKLVLQAKELNCKFVGIFDETKVGELKQRLPFTKIFCGQTGLEELVSESEIDFVIVSIVGMEALNPTITAIKHGKGIGLANKEILVSAGEMIMSLAKENGVSIMPIDSEHSAIFQCLQGENREHIRRIILTASGGPFLSHSEKELEMVSIKEALAHPTWSMGSKITVDSSTLMNKGLEMIEASFLFDLPAEKIDVVIHPQSIIHSMVEFTDTSIKAQMGMPNMSLPIQYALTYPERIKGPLVPFDFTKNHSLEFFPPDREKFKAISLAYTAMAERRSFPCFLNAANEVLVNKFLEGKIGWKKIIETLEKLMDRHRVQHLFTFEDVLNIDKEARERAIELSVS